MTWRWVWARSRVTAVVVSALLWLVIVALAPAVVAVVFLLAVVAVASWDSSLVLRWRYGARHLPDVDRDAVLRALVPVQALRGRNQPDLWGSRRLGASVVAATRRHLVVGDRLVEQLRHGRVTDEQLSRLAVRALGAAEVNGSRFVASVEFLTFPWLLLVAVIMPISGRVVHFLPVSRFAWSARWLFVGLAAVDLGQRGLWVPLGMLVLAAIATVTTPRANRAWAVRLEQLADEEAERHGFGSPSRSGIAVRMPLQPRTSRPNSRSRSTGMGRA